jgi:hypothetical protein
LHTWFRAEVTLDSPGNSQQGLHGDTSVEEQTNPNADVGRSPITLEMLKALVLAALADGNVDLAAAMALAFNGLCRMGEVTAATVRGL